MPMSRSLSIQSRELTPIQLYSEPPDQMVCHEITEVGAVIVMLLFCVLRSTRCSFLDSRPKASIVGATAQGGEEISCFSILPTIPFNTFLFLRGLVMMMMMPTLLCRALKPSSPRTSLQRIKNCSLFRNESPSTPVNADGPPLAR